MAYKPKRYKKFVAAATTATLIAAAITEKTYTVVAFKSKNPTEDEKTRYLSDGIDCADWSNEYGDVDNLDDALLLIRHDVEVTDEDIKSFIAIMGTLNTFDTGFLEANYEPVRVKITETQLKENLERNDF